MSDPISPIDAMEPTGEGKSFLERMQRGMKNSDPETQKKFAETLERMVEQGKQDRESRNEYKKNFTGNTRVGGVGGGGGGGGMGGNKLSNRDLTKAYKKGGTVKSASARADGCCIKGKTRA